MRWQFKFRNAHTHTPNEPDQSKYNQTVYDSKDEVYANQTLNFFRTNFNNLYLPGNNNNYKF